MGKFFHIWCSYVEQTARIMVVGNQLQHLKDNGQVHGQERLRRIWAECK